MFEKFLSATLAWLSLCAVGIQAADPPGVTVLGPPTVAPTPAAPSVYEVPTGRFIPFVPLSGGPVYLEENRAYRVYVVKPGERWTGIKYDAPADAENEPWTAPADAKGPVYILLARGYLGSYSVQPVKNGKTLADAPEKDGAPLKIQIVSGKGPKPPPDVDPTPTDPVLTPFQTKLKAAIKGDAATAPQVSLYAALYRNAAKSTVYDDGLTTSANMLAEMQRAVKLLGLPPGSLDKTARVVADELNTLVPKTNIVLEKPARDNIAAVFTRIAADLEAAK